MTIIEIEQERKRCKISIARLCSNAGVSDRGYHRMRNGERNARADTIARLVAGLSAARRNEKPVKSQMLFRLVLGQLAMLADMDLATVMAHDPQAKATADPKWMEISRMRAIACYMLHAVLGLSNAEVARAAGVSQPAITIAMQKIEIRRDDPALERIFAMLEMAVSG